MTANGTDSPKKRTNRGWLYMALGMLVLVGAIGLLIYWKKDGFAWDLFWGTFLKLDPWWLAASGVLALSTYVGRAFRWRVLIRPMHPNANLWNLFTATAVGFTAIVLFGRPGEMVRPYLIATKEKLSFSSQVAAWMLERIYDLLMALLIFGIALSRVKSSGVQVGPSLQWVMELGGYAVGLVSALCLTVLILLRQFTDKMRQRLMDGLGFLPEKYHSKMEGIVSAFTHGVQSTKNHWFVVQILIWSVVEWVVIVACYYCIFKASAVTAHFSLMDVLIFVGFVAFGAVVQIPGIGGGLQIVSVVVLTQLFQMQVEIASGLAVILWAITFVVVVPIGLALAFHDGVKWSRLRHLDESLSPTES